MTESKVVVIGAGPVGLTLAMDLAWRGIDVVVIESRASGEPPAVKCNTISSRSMEVYRRMGIAHKIREVGLPPDHSTDVSSRTAVTGIELSRLKLPSRNGRKARVPSPDSGWPTPEPSHRCNQIFFEPVIFEYAAQQPRIKILSRHEFLGYEQQSDRVLVRVRDLETSEEKSIVGAYMVGCDGGRSNVRQMIGSTFVGTAQIQRVQSSFIRAPKLLELLGPNPAWMYFVLNPRRCGTVIAIDGKERWNVHNFLYNDEEYDDIDRDWAIRQILGVDPEFEYEIVSQENWMGRRMVADKMRDGRVFIAGDACHLWIPAAGYGMNAGIADAAELAWMLAAVLQGWASEGILGAYEAERKPITEQISHIITDVAVAVKMQRRNVPENIEEHSAAGAESRRQAGDASEELEVKQQCSAGLNFGYFYADSPIIAYDAEAQPAYSMHEFTSSTVPGCRAPHVWLEGNRSLYDELGPFYTVVRLDPSVSVDALLQAAQERGVPLKLLDVRPSEAGSPYIRKLTLVRPDQYVAWRGDAVPADPLGLVDLIRGAARVDEALTA
ncbi:FAD-dependent oxidoreductase [Cupriavidus sp. CV2]|uniref:FAD-dependent oxidoreductase n=1 Tax=Cupriavidus ulmosensis TaxID=3065913 RepID=UPI00296B35A8|nr:FAD-dependent oxidoreductase [Cupriavidus sp. CV2]MDW3687578.1 FAD-dependent oxidoreductase [Cupriavidus sp. CV2]